MENKKNDLDVLYEDIEKIIGRFKILELAMDKAEKSKSIDDLYSVSNELKNITKLCKEKMKNIIIFHKNLFNEEIIYNKELIGALYENTIFPPIYYLRRNEINADKIISMDSMQLEQWVLNNDIRLFYLDRIKYWKGKFNSDSIKKMLEEVYHSVENNNYFSAYFVINVVIEYMLNEYIEDPKNNRYKKLRKIFKKKVFKSIKKKGIYTKFINNNLYCDTSRAEEFSRHTVHGDRLESITPKAMMNMIFIFDFLQEVIYVSGDR